MYYEKIETYTFRMPKEHDSYIRFKDNLKDADIHYTNEGGSEHQIIKITTTGRLDISNGRWP